MNNSRSRLNARPHYEGLRHVSMYSHPRLQQLLKNREAKRRYRRYMLACALLCALSIASVALIVALL